MIIIHVSIIIIKQNNKSRNFTIYNDVYSVSRIFSEPSTLLYNVSQRSDA